jgi:formyltetrahydrofolate deformylase
MPRVQTRVLNVECPDRRGLVHAITGVLLSEGLNVVGNQEFVDPTSNRFFMRTEVEGAFDEQRVVSKLQGALGGDAIIRFPPLAPKRIVVLASKEHHCVADILVRHMFHELNCTLLAVIANHDSLRSLVESFRIPFHHIASTDDAREAHEDALLKTLAGYDFDYLVLAKYMRILSPSFVQRYAHRIINIHHSFLPAFVGARPYQQAYERGVKVIGATAHFVTADLDQGPIIVQQIIPVDHTHSPQDLAASGRDVEQMVLARALKLVFEDRVFLCGNRTILFD